ncbi:(E3-independent) E2 ubiquitin-conjugating enzyme-like [Anneissia japonica]|uniref:(E3-independent) E2 ubiquitin-conjugating enzyme-like n=1 Tax=Anneissia japonica TaxID=1529436 RepID=UPI001425B7FE|nr:(E3-independent) E2 ubiquitin-conjugating enzyme-like [Anneissia japonica]
MAKLFVEDVIVKKLRGGKYQFGLVVTNYETYDSSDEFSDNDDDPTTSEGIKAGQVRVAWYPKGNEEVVDDSKVTLYDRSLMPGDVVYSLSKGIGAQCGFVRSVNIRCHVRIFKSKQMIYDVDSRDLHQIMEFEVGDHVVLGLWLGTVREVSCDLVIKLQNGARYEVTDEGASKLTDVHDSSEEFSVFNDQDGYYPGQVLHGPSSVFKKAKWLSGTKPIMGSKTNFRGTVEKVQRSNDGTTEKNIRSSQLCPLNQMDELEFLPGDFVLQNENIDDGVYGLIVSANHQDRTCTVKWYKSPLQQQDSLQEQDPLQQQDPLPQYTHTTETSVYDLMPHRLDYDFNTGDVVVGVQIGNTEQDIPSAGEILWINTDGTIEVMWVDGRQSVALPQDLYKLDEDSDSDWSDDEDDGKWHLDNQSIEGSDSSWETASEGSEGSASITSLSRDLQASTLDENNEKNMHSNVDTLLIEGEAPVAGEPTATEELPAIGEPPADITSNNTEMNNQQPNKTMPTNEQKQSTDSKATEDSSRNIQTERKNINSSDVIDTDKVDSEGVVTQSGKSTADKEKCDDVQYAESDKAGIAVCKPEDSQHSNKLVAVESVPANHIFCLSPYLPTAPKRFISTVKKEINLLQCSLPDGILVKTFEDRMDLFSVLIEGPKNTPYEDALFYFDVRLPSDYPGVPPVLHYHSYCSRRLNPNLYEDGKVCISLLGTWTGKHNEMWNSKSTLLQVLVSIQGLILVAEPYYNEAGFEKHRGSSLGEENSRMYNEMTLLKVVQSMTRMLLNPPSVFKDEVIDFCRKHNQCLVNRIESWLALAGTPPSKKPGLPAFPLFPFSKGFLLSSHQAMEAYKSALTQMLST